MPIATIYWWPFFAAGSSVALRLESSLRPPAARACCAPPAGCCAIAVASGKMPPPATPRLPFCSDSLSYPMLRIAMGKFLNSICIRSGPRGTGPCPLYRRLAIILVLTQNPFQLGRGTLSILSIRAQTPCRLLLFSFTSPESLKDATNSISCPIPSSNSAPTAGAALSPTTSPSPTSASPPKPSPPTSTPARTPTMRPLARGLHRLRHALRVESFRPDLR